MKTPTDQVWAYLHNELSTDARRAFEQALQNDDALQIRLKECQAIDTLLAEQLPQHESANEAQIDELLGLWEEEHPDLAEKPTAARPGKILYFIAPAAAAAAAAMILIAQPSKPIHWQNSIYGGIPQLRGGPAAQPHYARSELKQVVRDLQQSIEASFEGSGTPSLQITIQELADGALMLEVASDFKAWNKSFHSLENLRQTIPMVGKRIADEL